MNKFIKLFLITVIIAIIGCLNNVESKIPDSGLEIIGETKYFADSLIRIIDNNTGVIYIAVEGIHSISITPCYNSDGSLLLIDDLEVKR